MAKYSNSVEYRLKTTLDASGITKLQSELRSVQTELQKMSAMDLIGKDQSSKALKNIKEIEDALTKAFNSNLGMLNVDKFMKSLSTGNRSIQEWSKSFSTAGTQGQLALTSLIGRLGKIDTGLKSVSKTTDKIFNTFGNTVRWGVTASVFQTMTNSLYRAVDYVKELDKSLNDIRIVSEYSAADMREFSLQANDAAKKLGQTTTAYTNASLIFAQQGFDMDKSNQLAEAVLKVANTTGQATSEVSEQVTALMNGFQLSVDEIEPVLDKVTKVAAVGAADTEELMTAASKVASVANMLGVTEDQLIAQMSTIISVTREAPESVGNALKTIYARLGDLSMGETLEDGTDLGELSGTLEMVGVKVLDDTGALRNMGDVLEDLMNKWSSFDTAQQQSLAIKLAGKYQYTRFSALMQEQAMYQDQLQESMNAEGFLDETQAIYMEGLAAKINSLQTAFEGLITTVFDSDSFKPFIDGLTDTVTQFTNLIEVIGGGGAALTAFGAIATKVFSKNIAQSINSLASNFQRSSERKQSARARDELFANGFSVEQLDEKQMSKPVKGVYDFAKDVGKYQDSFSEQQLERYNSLLQQRTENVQTLVSAEEQLNHTYAQGNILLNEKYQLGENILEKNEDGTINTGKLKNTRKMFYDVDGSFTGDKSKAWQDFTTGTLNGMNALQNARKKLETFNSLQNKTSEEAQKMAKEIESEYKVLDSSVGSIKQTGIIVGEELQDLEDSTINAKDALKYFVDINENVNASTEEVSDSITLLQQKFEDYYGALEKAKNKADEELKIITDIENQNAQYSQAKAAVKTDEAAGESFEKNISQQVNLQKIVEATSIAGDLYFSWQSLQSLGGIFVDEDITNGEKISQIFQNLIISMPMLLNSLNSIKNLGWGEGVSTQLQSFSKNMKSATRQTRLGAVAANIGSKAIGGLGKAFSALGGPIGVATLLFSGLITILGAVKEKAEATRQAIYNAAESSNTKFQDVSSAQNNYNDAVKQYEEGSISLDEFKRVAQETSEALNLNIPITDNLASSYENLTIKINDAAEAEAKKAEQANKIALAQAEKDLGQAGYKNWYSAMPVFGDLTPLQNFENQSLDLLFTEGNSENGSAILSSARSSNISFLDALAQNDKFDESILTEEGKKYFEALQNEDLSAALDVIYSILEQQQQEYDTLNEEFSTLKDQRDSAKSERDSKKSANEAAQETAKTFTGNGFLGSDLGKLSQEDYANKVWDVNKDTVAENLANSAEGKALSQAEGDLRKASENADTAASNFNSASETVVNIQSDIQDAQHSIALSQQNIDERLQYKDNAFSSSTSTSITSNNHPPEMTETNSKDFANPFKPIDVLIDEVEQKVEDDLQNVEDQTALLEELSSQLTEAEVSRDEAGEALIEANAVLEKAKAAKDEAQEKYNGLLTEEEKKQKEKAEQDYQNAVEAAEKAQADFDKADKAYSDLDTSYKKAQTNLENLKKSIENYNEILNSPEFQQYIETRDALAKILAQENVNDLYQEKLLNNPNADLQNVTQSIIDQDSALGQYLRSLDSYSEQISFLLEYISDETAKAAMEAEYIRESYRESANEWYTKSLEKNQGYFSKGNLNYQNLLDGDLTNITAGQYVQEATQYILDEINKLDGYSQEEKNEFILTLDTQDFDHALQQLEEFRNKAIESVDSALKPMDFAPESTEKTDEDRSIFTDEEISSISKESNLTDSAFGRMAQNLFDNSELGTKAEGIREEYKALEEEAKAAKQAGKSTDEYVDAMNDLKKEYDRIKQTTKDITAANLRMNKGVSNLVDSWEDLSEVLSQDASKGTADWYQAVGELDEILSDILNIDPGDLSTDFFQPDTSGFEAIQRLAEGDVAALDDLRAAAAEDIIQHLDLQSVDGRSTDAAITGLMNLLPEFRAQFEGATAGMSIDCDTSPFINAMNTMLKTGQMSAEQATKILSSIGCDMTIENVPTQVTTTHVAHYPNYKLDTEGDSVRFVPDGMTEITYDETTEGSYPRIVGGEYNGPGVQTVGAASSGNTGGGSGGSPGGGGSSYTPKTKDKIEKKPDRYEKVNTRLNALQKDYDKLNKARERATSFNKVDDMAKELSMLEKENELYNEKLDIQKREAEELKNELSQDKYGITFDDEGFISNYYQVHEKLTKDVNDLIDQYNAATTEAEQEAIEKKIEDAQKILDDFEEKYARYDTLVSQEMKETTQAIQDNVDAMQDIYAEALRGQLEALDNIKELNEAMTEYTMAIKNLGSDGLRLDDPTVELTAGLKNLSYYWDNASEAADNYYKGIDDWLAKKQDEAATDDAKNKIAGVREKFQSAWQQIADENIQTFGNGYISMAYTNLQFADYIRETNDLSEEQKEELLKQILEQGQQTIVEYKKAMDELEDKAIAVVDDMSEKMDRRTEQFENLNEILDHQSSMIEMLHGDKSYEELNKIAAAQIHNNKAQMADLQNNLQIWKNLKTTLKEGSDLWNEVNDKIVEGESKMRDLAEQSQQLAIDAYNRNVASVLDKWIDSALGNDLEWIQQEWELINRNADYYLDDVNAAYETQKLQNKYLEMLDGTDDLHIQQQITDQMREQLDYLREKKNISEYDVAYANAQLEILQKRIALEEAERNKNQIKLRRDSQGNYSYVYTANKEDTRGKEQDLLDAQNNAYNLSKEQMRQTQEDSLSALGDAKNLLNNIWTDANLTLEEKKKRTETIIGSLKEYLAGTSEQLSESQKNIINDFIGMCEILTDENSDRLDDVYQEIISGNLEAFDQIDTRWSTSLTAWLQNMDEFIASTNNTYDELISKSNDWASEVSSINDLAGENYDDLANMVGRVVDKTNELTAAQSTFSNSLENDLNVLGDYTNMLADYESKIGDLNQIITKYDEEIQRLNDDLKKAEYEKSQMFTETEVAKIVEDSKKEAENQKNNSSGSSNKNNSNSGKNNVDKDLAWGIAQVIWTYADNGWGNDPIRSSKLKKAYGDAFAKQVQDYIDQYANTGQLVNYDSMKYSSYSLVGYDTGGYTGSWGPEGKVALLHQKELVLNAADTENILQTVQAVRDMTSQMKSSIFADIVSGLNQISSNIRFASNNEDIVQQEVHITAEFPNAESASDIREALLSLNDQAMQYSSRQR